jgi:anti-sigma factor RsiW
MKCADIWNALNDDTGDLRAVKRHLVSCPECSRRFARDLEIEEALRYLDLEVGPVDITAEVAHSLSSFRQRRSACDLVRRWVWAGASVAALVLLAITMPVLAGWLSAAHGLAGRLNVGASIESVMAFAKSPVVSSIRFIHVLYLMVAILAWLAAYLVRESKRTAQ